MPAHESQDELAYPREPLFDLAADVESYPEFLPGWIAARVVGREGNVYHTEQVVGFGTFRQRFRSQTLLERPERIVVTSTDRIFRNFDLTWLFEPLPDRGTRVTVRSELQLDSKLVQVFFDRALARSVASIMSAFEARARAVYGPQAGRRRPAGERAPPGSVAGGASG